MNQKKKTKQVVETQESKEKNGCPKNEVLWWIGMAAVVDYSGAGSGFGVGVIASQSSNNQQFFSTGPNGSEPRIQSVVKQNSQVRPAPPRSQQMVALPRMVDQRWSSGGGQG